MAAIAAATIYSIAVTNTFCPDMLLACFLFCAFFTLLLICCDSLCPALLSFAPSMLIHIGRFVKRLLPALQNFENNDKRQRPLHNAAHTKKLHARINRK